jgi:glutamyl-tRNA synthetase
VRTALFNYLFAKKNNGDFVLRIEDTDQTRFVEGAEDYIIDCLKWCGIAADESPVKPGKYAPYRQSERKSIYRQYAEQLVMQGHAYYAFDTPEELDKNRKEIPNFQYGQAYRSTLRNSVSLPQHEVDALCEADADHDLPRVGDGSADPAQVPGQHPAQRVGAARITVAKLGRRRVSAALAHRPGNGLW